VRREIFKGQNIMGRQTQNPLRVNSSRKFATCAEREFQGLSRLVVRHNDNYRLFGRAGK
jgi:hypothetical protein